MLTVMLPQEILAVVVSVRRAHDDVNVLAVGDVWVCRQVPEVRRPLMVELDEEHGAVNPVVEDAVRRTAADPGERGPVEMLTDLLHPHACVSVVHVVDVERNQIEELLALRRSEEHTSELQSQSNLVCRLLLEKKK